LELDELTIQFWQLVVLIIMAGTSIWGLIHQHKVSKLQIERPRINKLIRYIDELRDDLTCRLNNHSNYIAHGLNLEEWGSYRSFNKDYYRVFTECLAKYRKKDDWDIITNKYNKYCEELYKKKENLSNKLNALLNNNSVVIDNAYNNSIYAKDGSRGAFISELYNIQRFFENYKHRKGGSSLDGAWYYIGIQKFDEFIDVLKSDLDEIDKIIIEMNDLAENLIKILDNMSRRLKKEYHLPPSQDVSKIRYFI
jgi:hypothetical protein